MTFHDVRLPEDVEAGATGGPVFQTGVLPLSSGGEQRNINWEEARHEWELSYGIQNREDFEICRAFFFARRGMGHTFRFKDWSDFQVEDEVQGVGDAVNTSFQLIKVYEADGPAPYYRRITRPVAATVVWKVDGVIHAATPGALGLYTLSPAPGNGTTVTATCEFDMIVRFYTDKFAIELEQSEAGVIGSLPVIEVRE